VSDLHRLLLAGLAGRYYAVRLGFCMVRSLKQTDAEQLVDRRTYDVSQFALEDDEDAKVIRRAVEPNSPRPTRPDAHLEPPLATLLFSTRRGRY
jgi:hypothetical protein